MIIDGELRKGDKLPGERELAQRFEVSRASIREALKILSLQGLLHRTNAGTVVTTDFLKIIEETLTLKILLEDSSYTEISAARLVLEKSMVALAAKNITESELVLLENHLDIMDQAAKEEAMDDFVTSDVEFHRLIALFSRNSVLNSLYNSIIFLLFKVQTQVAYDKGVMQESTAYHRKIYQALAQKDAHLAEKEMEAHLIDIDKRLNHMTLIKELKNRN
jgi:GntR family transcriptional repressor for pyruvate dehydrogenase complex